MAHFLGLGGRGKGKGGVGVGGTFEEEDRSRDWYCGKCRERNFAKRPECFKCGAQKPKDAECAGPPASALPVSGATLNGMVKSYNKKGFGFIMCLGRPECQDIYYTREHLSSRLQTRDIPGEHVTFEILRLPNGKLEAKNIRPINTEPDNLFVNTRPPVGPVLAFPPKLGFSGGCGGGLACGGKEEEDRSRDWNCGSCGERNFVKRFECFRCKMPRPTATLCGFSEPVRSPAGVPTGAPRRTFSPHAGSRAVRQVIAARSPSSDSQRRGRRKKKKKKRSRSQSSSKNSGSSRSKKRARKKKAKKHRSRSRGSSSGGSRRSSGSTRTSSCVAEEAEGSQGTAAATGAKGSGNPAVEKAKAEALEQLVKLRDVEPNEARMKEWRALLRQWHPDKNPDRVEVATAVFQFLQKGKAMLEVK